jgi:ABC-type nitrate/sulfonate/bicarbonate transport system permease component
MAPRWLRHRTHEQELPASAATSRLLALGFLVAALLGLLAGIVWLGWNVARQHLGG